MINQKASGDSRYARTGKDGAFYNQDGVLLASNTYHVTGCCGR